MTNPEDGSQSDSTRLAATKNTLLDVASDFGELALDQVLDDGVLKEVPVVGVFVKLARAYQGINENLFIRKIALFCARLTDVSDEERAKFSDDLKATEDPKRVGELLILHLNSLNDVPKAILLGVAFRAVIGGKMDFETFQRIALAVDRCILGDLESLRAVGSEQIYLSAVAERSLASVGLLESRGGITHRPDGTSEVHCLSSLGEQFRDLVLEPCDPLMPGAA